MAKSFKLVKIKKIMWATYKEINTTPWYKDRNQDFFMISFFDILNSFYPENAHVVNLTISDEAISDYDLKLTKSTGNIYVDEDNKSHTMSERELMKFLGTVPPVMYIAVQLDSRGKKLTEKIIEK